MEELVLHNKSFVNLEFPLPSHTERRLLWQGLAMVSVWMIPPDYQRWRTRFA